MPQYDEAKHPRSRLGQFTTKPRPDLPAGGSGRLREAATQAAVAGGSVLERPTRELSSGLADRSGAALRLAADPARQVEAQAVLREVASLEDAILTRHPDPYGAALVQAGWEHHAGPLGDGVEVRRWLMGNPGLPADQIQLGLDELSRRAQVSEPWAQPLNQVAAARAVFLRDQTPEARQDLRDAEAAWVAVAPPEVAEEYR